MATPGPEQAADRPPPPQGEKTDHDAPQKRPFTLLPRLSRTGFISLLWLVAALELAVWQRSVWLPFFSYFSTYQQELLLILSGHGLALTLLLYIAGLRFRDTNRSSQWVLALLLPVANLPLLGLLLLAPGNPHWNRFGPPPGKPGRLLRLLGIYLPCLLLAAASALAYTQQAQLYQWFNSPGWLYALLSPDNPG